jgi:flagellar motor protein MotB
MISLLVTFFVLLMTFSSLDAYDALKIDAWLSGNKGTHKTRGWVMPDLPASDVVAFSSVERGSLSQHTRPADKLPEDLEAMGQKLTDGYQEANIHDVKDGLVIEFGDEACFDPGSTELSAEMQRSLTEIGEVLENYPHLVVVEGHTDAAFRPTAEYPSADAVSLARAKAGAEFLLASSSMNSKLLQIGAYGDRKPRADNVSGSGRRLNRRIQLRILSLSKVRANYLESQEAR